MTDIVVDASIAVLLLFPDTRSGQAIALFEDAARVGWRLAGPPLLPVEVTNVIRRHMRRERLSLQTAMAILDDFLAQPIDLLGGADLHRDALRLTAAFSLGAHGAHYVALAQRLGCERSAPPLAYPVHLR